MTKGEALVKLQALREQYVARAARINPEHLQRVNVHSAVLMVSASDAEVEAAWATLALVHGDGPTPVGYSDIIGPTTREISIYVPTRRK